MARALDGACRDLRWDKTPKLTKSKLACADIVAGVAGRGDRMKLRIRSIVRPFALAVMAAFLSGSASAQSLFFGPRDQQFPAPACFTPRGIWVGESAFCTPAMHTDWLEKMTHWRMEEHIRIGYDPARYQMPALKWTQSA